MDNMRDLVPEDLVKELAQGREIAAQLNQLLNVPSSLSQERRGMMVEKIIATFEKTLAMINSTGSSMGDQPSEPTAGALVPMLSESSPLSFIPRSEDTDREFRDHEQQAANCNDSKKNLPKWTTQSRVSPETGLQGVTDDGYSWRKYGQKDILGAKHPRAYYRCTYRDVRGCLATKQVQRSDADQTIFDITYRGRHTCSDHSSDMNDPPISVENQETTDRDIFHQQQQPATMLVSFREALGVQTENLDTYYDQTTPPFYFPTDSQVDGPVLFSPSTGRNNFVGNFSHSYISPETSGVDRFWVSPNGMNSFGGNSSLPSSESDVNDNIISAATSAANSPTIGLDYPFGHVEFEPNFSFNKPGFFS